MNRFHMNDLEKRLERLESHLSVLSKERIEQVDEKLDNFGHDLNQRITILEMAVKSKTENINILLDLQKLTLDHHNDNVNVQNSHVFDNQLSRQEQKLNKIKEKTTKFLSTISVHGIGKLVRADNSLVKSVWMAMILVSFTAGMFIISRSVKDYFQYDVITNIKRMTPNSVTFPAITICFYNEFTKIYYINGLPVKSEITYNVSIQTFLRHTMFKNKELDTTELEFFQITNGLNKCVRFNGIAKQGNKVEVVNTTSERLDLKFLTVVSKIISKNQQVKYKLSYDHFDLYVGDNYLNSYLNSIPLRLVAKDIHSFHVVKSLTEKRLGQPYNDCDESLNGSYRQMNCIEECINRDIKYKYNCSIPSYYRISGLQECRIQTKFLTSEFQGECEKMCPKECESNQFRTDVLSSSSNELDLYFYFSDLSYLEITQIPKLKEFSLIASIGGSLGLFVGIRFLSLVEVLEYLIDVFYVVFIERFY